MVVGGGAMHLNDALGHKEGLHCTYNHHEQACAMAAEAYARVNNRIAAVCVTTGPGMRFSIVWVWVISSQSLILKLLRYGVSLRLVLPLPWAIRSILAWMLTPSIFPSNSRKRPLS